MVNKYEKILAQALVDAYNSGKKSIKPTKISDKYDDPYDLVVFDAINDAAKVLEEKGHVEIKVAGKATRTIKSIKLMEGSIEQLAEEYKLETKEVINARIESVLVKYENSEFNSIRDFVETQRKNMESGKVIKGVHGGDATDLGDYLLGAQMMLSQQEDILLRNFSEDVFGDSKRFEAILTAIFKIVNIDNDAEVDFLQQCHIFKNPVYVAFKGNCDILFKDGTCLTLSGNDAMQLSQSLVDRISEVKTTRILTIENLTTYTAHIPSKDDGLFVYLGGFSNHTNISFLRKSNAPIYHFGDIDANGYGILHDLQRRVEREVSAWHMDKATIEKYRNFGKPMNKCNIDKFEKMIDDDEYTDAEKNIFRHLLDCGIVIEQEAIR